MRNDGPRPFRCWDRDPGIERIGRVDRTLEAGAQLVEPFLRPDPASVHALGCVHERVAALRRLHPLHARVPGRICSEHDSAADRRPCAEDDAVAARRDDGRGEPQLRVAVADEDDAREHVGRAVMHVHARGDVRQRLERHVEAVARPIRARSDERVAAAHVAAFDARERDRYALARVRAVDGAVVHLHAAYPDGPPARLDA